MSFVPRSPLGLNGIRTNLHVVLQPKVLYVLSEALEGVLVDLAYFVVVYVQSCKAMDGSQSSTGEIFDVIGCQFQRLEVFCKWKDIIEER